MMSWQRVLLLTLMLGGQEAAPTRLWAGSTQTYTSDAQFNISDLANVQVRGTGAGASVELAHAWAQGAAPPMTARRQFGIDYDTRNAVAVAFGGLVGGVANGETWVFWPATSTWQQRFPTGSPPPARYGHSLTAIGGGKFLCFGGWEGIIGYSTGTWVYDVTADSWTSLTLSTFPSARAYHAVVFSTTSRQAILFGGLDGPASYLGDTWRFDVAASSWALLAPASSPSARRYHAMTWDPSTNRAILFGGQSGAGNQNDTWLYPWGGAWSNPAPSGPPSLRQQAMMAWDGYNGRALLFGGQDPMQLGDTWMYSPGGNSWTTAVPISTPPARYGGGLFFVSSSSETILVSGTGTSDYQDLWRHTYRPSGSITLPKIDAPFAPTSLTWQTLTLLPYPQPAGTSVRFQIASSSDDIVYSSYLGPDDTTGTFYDYLGTPVSISAYHADRRYLRVKAFLSSTDYPKTPVLDELRVTYNRVPAGPVLASPTGFASVNVTTPTFQWAAPTDADGDAILSYQIQVATESQFLAPVLAATGVATLSWSTTTALSSGLWHWRARGHDGAAYGVWPSDAGFYVDTTPPSAVSVLASARGAGNGALDVSWTVTGDDAVTGAITGGIYRIRLATAAILTGADWAAAVTEWTGVLTATAGATAGVTVTGLVDATTYYAGVKIADEAGNLSPLSTVSPAARTNAPPVVAYLAPAAGTALSGTTDIRWSASDPEGDGWTTAIWLSTNGGTSFSLLLASGLASSATTYAWVTKGQANGGTDRIRVVATDARGLAGQADTGGNFTIANPNDPPSVTLTAPAGGGPFSGILVASWTVSDPNLSDTHAAVVELSADDGASYSAVIASGISATSYAWNTAAQQNGSRYRLRVTVTDSGTPALSSSVVSGTSFAILNNSLPPNPFDLRKPADGASVSPLSLTLAWEANGDPNAGDALLYRLEVSLDQAFSTTLLAASVTVNAASYDPPLGWLGEGRTYWWRVIAVDPWGLERRSGSSRSFMLSRATAVSLDGVVGVEASGGLPAGGYLLVTSVGAASAAPGSPVGADLQVGPPLQEASANASVSRRLKLMPGAAYRVDAVDSLRRSIAAPDLAIKISFAYDDADKDGRPDGSKLDAAYLQVARLDGNQSRWVLPPAAGTLDRAARRASAVHPAAASAVFALAAAAPPADVLSEIFNFPNPFAADREPTTFVYTLSKPSRVTLRIYTPFGDLVHEAGYEAGAAGGQGSAMGTENEIVWDGRNGAGAVVANGLYLAEIEADSGTDVKRRVRRVAVLK